MPIPTENTSFTHDILGRYVCNTFGEANNSEFVDVIIIGGGTFALTLAHDGLNQPTRALQTEELPDLVLNRPDPHYRRMRRTAQYGQSHGRAGQSRSNHPPGRQPAWRPITADNALPATRDELEERQSGQDDCFRELGHALELDTRFGGLHRLGGRSIYFGGWSPRYLATEMETAPTDALKSATAWPQTLVDDLNTRYFLEGGAPDRCFDFGHYIAGTMTIFSGSGCSSSTRRFPMLTPIAELPDYVTDAQEDQGPRIQDIASGALPPPYPGYLDSLRLDAPLAVQILACLYFSLSTNLAVSPWAWRPRVARTAKDRIRPSTATSG